MSLNMIFKKKSFIALNEFSNLKNANYNVHFLCKKNLALDNKLCEFAVYFRNICMYMRNKEEKDISVFATFKIKASWCMMYNSIRRSFDDD